MPESQKGLQSTANSICEEYGAQGVVIILLHPDNSIYFSGSGVNHMQANEMLSLGIHVNLKQHDALVLAGGAGQEAQQKALNIEAINNGRAN